MICVISSLFVEGAALLMLLPKKKQIIIAACSCLLLFACNNSDVSVKVLCAALLFTTYTHPLEHVYLAGAATHSESCTRTRYDMFVSILVVKKEKWDTLVQLFSSCTIVKA